MEFEEARPFMESNHPGVISTYQRSGAIHNSIVVCGAYKGNAAFVAVRGNSRKVHNLRRNPHCSVLSVKPDWRSFVIVEGQAQLFDARNTEAEELLVLLREATLVTDSISRPPVDSRGYLEQLQLTGLVPNSSN